jgi:outer membrane protein OmpA-like peptidoglycan-associated protein
MKIKYRSLGFIVVSILSIICFSPAQEALRNELFGDADKLLNQAREKKANLYSPSSFEKAMNYYSEADEYFKKGKSLEDMREKIKNASAYFAKAIDQSKIGEVTFTTAMGARIDAERAGALKYSQELWKKAEEQFDKAARELEDGDVKSAKEYGAEAEVNYRAAELEAIKSNYLSPARELLKQADETDVADNAPKTITNARKLTLQVENLLKQNRYDTDEARQLAEGAKYEAAHALYLNRTIEKMKQDRKEMEEILLTKEFDLKRIGSVLDVNAHFENGFDPVIIDIISAVKAKDAKISNYADSLKLAEVNIRSKEDEIENLKQQIDLMIKRLGTLSDAEMKLQEQGKELQRKLDRQHNQEATIKKVASMFNEEEGNVLREGDAIILRLYGLTFPVGKSAIESQYYPLLSKVQEAILKFPRSRIKVEGHTDSQGGDDINQTLSEKRANAVAEYLMANMSVEFPVNSEGFGETKPIASNDTPEGRAKNRRIDVVITPEWAEGK